jgi:hypothetical protein
MQDEDDLDGTDLDDYDTQADEEELHDDEEYEFHDSDRSRPSLSPKP